MRVEILMAEYRSDLYLTFCYNAFDLERVDMGNSFSGRLAYYYLFYLLL